MFNKYSQWISHTDKEIKGFFNDFRWLSNFQIAPHVYKGILFPATENSYQASKVIGTPDEKMFEEFSQIAPNKSKFLGRKLTLRKDWDLVKLDIMREVNVLKYKTNGDLQAKLIATRNKYLEETNSWGDKFFGVDYKTGIGENHLGKILMSIRVQFQAMEKEQFEFAF